MIVVDDGIATGSTGRAACLAARARGASRVILAVPVGSAEGTAALRRTADEVVCLHTPAPFFAVGEWYGDFGQVTDEEVTILLRKAAVARPDSMDPDPAEVALKSVVPGRATHLFEEPGALGQVADLARDWFTRHFAQVSWPR